MSGLDTCPRCGKKCSARYREVPRGQPATFVCEACILDLGLPLGGYARPGSVEVVNKLLGRDGRPN